MLRLATATLVALSLGAFAADEPEFNLAIEGHKFAPDRIEVPAGKKVKRLTPLDSEADEPTWSPDGKRIAFVSMRDGFRELYVMNADGANARRITTLHGQIHAPSWSPFLPPVK